jgi:hypothetical protein
VSGFVFGERGRIVEHDPATRQPVPGGRVIGAVAVEFSMNGTTSTVPDEFLPGAVAEFWSDGWITDDSHRWRLMPAQEPPA